MKHDAELEPSSAACITAEATSRLESSPAGLSRSELGDRSEVEPEARARASSRNPSWAGPPNARVVGTALAAIRRATCSATALVLAAVGATTTQSALPPAQPQRNASNAANERSLEGGAQAALLERAPGSRPETGSTPPSGTLRTGLRASIAVTIELS